MEDDFHVSQEGPQLRDVAHVPSSERHRVVQHGGISRAEVINDPDAMSKPHQMIGYGRAYETRATRHQDLHLVSLNQVIVSSKPLSKGT